MVHNKKTRYKTIKKPSAKLLSELNALDKQYFTVSEAYEIMKDSEADSVRKLLSLMVQRGLLLRIKDGVYHIIPYDKDPETYQPNWHITSPHLVEGADYYLGYYTALSIHSLITQPALKEQIVINKQVSKKVLKIKDIEFQLIYHNNTHFFGAKNTWIDDFNKIKCSDLEKTIIDCLFMPEYAGGIVEIGKAIYKSKDNFDYIKLYDYIVKFESQAIIKRLGFLLELLKIENPIIQKFQKLKSASYTLLDPALPKKGKMFSRWSIQQNIDTETLLSALSH